MKRKSILDLPKSPLPKVAIYPMETGGYRAAIMFPGAWEPAFVDRPTYRGCENELIHQLRKRGYQGWDAWTDLQKCADEGTLDDDGGLEPPDSHYYPRS